MFPYLEHITGNRFPDINGGIKGLHGTRRWDAVIDTWQGPPGCVGLTTELLKKRADHYLYISSIATYMSYKEHGITEAAPLPDMSGKINSYSDDLGYSERKRAAEQAVLGHYPRNGSVLRCGSIRGESYSPVREAADFYHHHLRLGNTLVLPDDTEAKFQLIDVKDLANFGLNIIDKDSPGSYNMVGPGQPLNFKEYIREIHQATDNIATIHWADYSWLKERNISPWNDLPNYIPMSDPEPGFYTISNEKAIKAGLTFRPVFTTVVESLDNLSLDQLRRQETANGLSEDRRLALIEDWEEKARNR
jgi:2'-hydroxyisoflavone reductase